MKIKSGFILKEVVGQAMIVPTGEVSKNFNGYIKLNVTGKDVWNGIKEGLTVEQIAEKLVTDYEDVTMDTALEATKNLINQMEKAGVLEM